MPVSDVGGGIRPAAGPPIFRRHQLPGAAVVVAAALVVAQILDTGFGYGLLHSWLVLTIAGLGFYLVFGVAGQFAFSQGAFFGLGAYASVWASEGRSFGWGFLAAIGLSCVVALALGLIVLRSDQLYFAIATLAFGHLAIVVFREFEAFTAPGGEIVGIPKPSLFGRTFNTDPELATFLTGALALALVLVALIERSPLKREALALHHHPVVAATLGVPTARLRLLAFVLGSAFAGAAGSLHAHKAGFISTETFGIVLAIDIFLLLLLGGMDSMWGPLLGAAFVVWAPEQLRFIGDYRNLVYGAILVVVIVAFPKGLVGLAELVWSRRPRRFGGGPLVAPAELEAERAAS